MLLETAVVAHGTSTVGRFGAPGVAAHRPIDIDSGSMAVAEITRENLSSVANEIVRLKAHYYGKGPTEAKAYQNDDVLVVTLKGGLTTVEKTLLDAGDSALVRQVRLRFQEVMAANFIDAVQRLTGREVLSYMSQVVFDPDFCFEFFVLD